MLSSDCFCLLASTGCIGHHLHCPPIALLTNCTAHPRSLWSMTSPSTWYSCSTRRQRPAHCGLAPPSCPTLLNQVRTLLPLLWGDLIRLLRKAPKSSCHRSKAANPVMAGACCAEQLPAGIGILPGQPTGKPGKATGPWGRATSAPAVPAHAAAACLVLRDSNPSAHASTCTA